ncbi:hypothetical protein C2E23DRAFT_854687 [Lenzites betulinus]|nr:hypothetical protein C2E23DRAFT_854687 [Lenzites betulinus]
MRNNTATARQNDKQSQWRGGAPRERLRAALPPALSHWDSHATTLKTARPHCMLSEHQRCCAPRPTEREPPHRRQSARLISRSPELAYATYHSRHGPTRRLPSRAQTPSGISKHDRHACLACAHHTRLSTLPPHIHPAPSTNTDAGRDVAPRHAAPDALTAMREQGKSSKTCRLPRRALSRPARRSPPHPHRCTRQPRAHAYVRSVARPYDRTPAPVERTRMAGRTEAGRTQSVCHDISERADSRRRADRRTYLPRGAPHPLAKDVDHGRWRGQSADGVPAIRRTQRRRVCDAEGESVRGKTTRKGE